MPPQAHYCVTHYISTNTDVALPRGACYMHTNEIQEKIEQSNSMGKGR